MERQTHPGNNFDFIRFVAALFVVWGHSYVLANGSTPPAIWGRGIHAFGLVIFFCISGYLVTQSWQRSSSVYSFCRKRFLRIMPGLTVCVLLTMFVVGPIMTTLPADEYFANHQIYRYAKTILLHIEYNLPGVFKGNLHKAVNGSLWSLTAEVWCYFLLAIVGLVASKWFRPALVVVVVVTAAASLWLSFVNGRPIVVYAMGLKAGLSLFPFFFVGAVLATLRVNFRADVAFGLMAILFIATASHNLEARAIAQWAFVPYIVLTFGTMATKHLSQWGSRFGDMSYGIYLYSALIQQSVAHIAGGRTSVVVMLVFAAPLSVFAGKLSWHLVEKSALRLK